MRNLCTICTGKRDANFGSPDGEFLFFTCAKEPLRCKSYSYEGESILLAGNGDISNISLYNGRFEAYQRTYILQSPTPLYLPYLYYHLQYNWVDYNIGKVFGSAIPYIRLGNLENYPVALPPLEEQKRIVAKIEEMLPLIDRYGEAHTELETFNKRFPDDLRKSILQEAIQGKLVPQLPEEGTAEELYQQIQAEKQRLIAAGTIKKEKPLPPIEEKDLPFDIPETWKWVRLGDCFDIATGKTPSKSEPQNYMPAVVPFFKPADILNGERIETCSEYVSEQGAQAAPLFTSGSLLVNCIGNIGRCAIVEREGICNQQINIIMKNECCDMRYILHVMLSDCVRLQEISLSTETTITLLNKNNFRTILIPLPPLKEQKRIVAKIEEMLALCKSMR